MSLILSGTDGLSDVDGTAATPAIRGTDANTGIFFPAADTIAFSEGGVEAARFDSSGNFGLGVTPSAWNTGFKALQIGAEGALWSSTSTAATWLTRNVFLNTSSSFRYIASDYANALQIDNDGAFKFYTAASGTAGNAITFTQAMTLDASGNLGVGITTPGARLDASIDNPTRGIVQRARNGASSGQTGVQFQFTQNGIQDWVIGQPAGVDAFVFWSGRNPSADGTERMRIDSSGNLLVGTTGLPLGNGKLSVSGNSRFYQSSSDSATAITVDKSSTTNTTSQIFVQFTVNNQNTGSGQINANGASQVAFGSFSDARLKENIVDLPPQLDNIMALRPVEFDYIEAEGGGHQIGFVAQEIETVFPDAVGERADRMKTVTGWNKTEARLVKAIQEQQALITTLTARITALEGA